MFNRGLSRSAIPRRIAGRRLIQLTGLAALGLLAAGGPAAGQMTFPIDTTLEVGDLNITATTSSAGPMIVVDLNNQDSRPARCLLVYRNGPETQRRRTDVAPGTQRTVSQSLRREVVRLRVTVSCEPGES